MQQKEKLNELIGVIHEKDELLDSQEEFLIKENKKHVKVKNAYAQEVEKNENLTKELSICHDSIVNFRNDNASLIAKIDKLNESISSLKIENASLISKAKDLNVCNDSISSLRNENAILHAKIDELKSCKPSTSTVEHFKFARSMLYSGRHPEIKDGIGFQQGSNVKLNAPKRLSNFVKGKAHMAQDNEGYILYPAGYLEHKIIRIHARKPHNVSHHAFMYKNEASNSRQSTHVKLPKKRTPTASNDHNISFKTFDASYVLTNKSSKVVAKYVGGKHKGSKTSVWITKVLISNIKGPKTVWVPKNKA
jgi:predicted RNase H-like nuclease (RuvC/YqgF family)